MFLEVDDGIFVNLNQVFSITYKNYKSRGLWVFMSAHVEERDHSLADKSNRKTFSRSFDSRGEAELWLNEKLENAGLIREKKKRPWGSPHGSTRKQHLVLG